MYLSKSGCTELQFLVLFITVLFCSLFSFVVPAIQHILSPHLAHTVFSHQSPCICLHVVFPFFTVVFLSHPACPCSLRHFPPTRTLDFKSFLISTSTSSSVFLSALPLPYFLTAAVLSLSPEGISITLVKGVWSQSPSLAVEVAASTRWDEVFLSVRG